jgi:hypothetical protein
MSLRYVWLQPPMRFGYQGSETFYMTWCCALCSPLHPAAPGQSARRRSAAACLVMIEAGITPMAATAHIRLRAALTSDLEAPDAEILSNMVKFSLEPASQSRRNITVASQPNSSDIRQAARP